MSVMLLLLAGLVLSLPQHLIPNDDRIKYLGDLQEYAQLEAEDNENHFIFLEI
jgi:hypothetical protein